MMRLALAVPTLVALMLTDASQAAERFTEPFGGDGGGQFILRCPAGKSVTGVTALVGAYVNNIAPVCDGLKLKGAGGSGKRSDAICPMGSVVGAIGMRLLRSPNRLLKEVVLQCVPRGGGETTASVQLHTAGAFTEGWDMFKGGTGPKDTSYPTKTSTCGSQRIVGLQGRAGDSVDALGLICS